MIPNNKSRFKRGEKHHWWPKSLSQFWKDEEGLVNRMDSRGEVIRSQPKEFAHIKNGHNFIVSGGSVWESTIEQDFDLADRNMRNVVKNLESFREWNYFEKRYDFAIQEEDDQSLNLLRHAIISLVVRSPLYRSRINNIVTSFRGAIPKAESNNLISANLGQCFRKLSQSIENRGKMAVLFSDSIEFIYGDGIYNTVPTSPQPLSTFEIIIPMTPTIAVVWILPSSYTLRPTATAHYASKEDVKAINLSTLIYSKDYIFYRSERPSSSEFIKDKEHMQFTNRDNPMSRLVRRLFPEQKGSNSLSWLV